MDFELFFSLAGILAMIGWLALLLSPWMPQLSDRIAAYWLPGVLSLGYIGLLLFFPADNGGGLGSLADVGQLFTSPGALLAGWIHFLAFDLIVGAWICRRARHNNMPFWQVLPCLPVTFLFGPAGFLLFQAIHALSRGLRA